MLATPPAGLEELAQKSGLPLETMMTMLIPCFTRIDFQSLQRG